MLTDEARAELVALSKGKGVAGVVALRARIVVWWDEGRSAREIVSLSGMSEPTVRLWPERYRAEGIDGLFGKPHPGKGPVHGGKVRARILALSRQSPPPELGGAYRQERTGAGVGGLPDIRRPAEGRCRYRHRQLERLAVQEEIITGDSGLVAAKVCSEIGVDYAGVLSGAEVESLDNDHLEAAILTATVFARISPDQKSRIVKVAHRTGKDVAFLGDGVNDAVALHHADVGISAGPTEFRTGLVRRVDRHPNLVVYVTRTRRVPFFTSRPSVPMLLVPTGVALVGAILPYTGLVNLLGVTPLPTAFFLLLFAMVVVHLLLVELPKTRFYRTPYAPTPPTPGGSARPVTSHAERLERHIRRRASRFIRHQGPRVGDSG